MATARPPPRRLLTRSPRLRTAHGCIFASESFASRPLIPFRSRTADLSPASSFKTRRHGADDHCPPLLLSTNDRSGHNGKIGYDDWLRQFPPLLAVMSRESGHIRGG